MKKLKMIAAGCLLLFFASSCTVTYHSVNSNPIGDKVGESSGTDYSFSTAAKKGDIEQISTTKIRYGYPLITPKTWVTGK